MGVLSLSAMSGPELLLEAAAGAVRRAMAKSTWPCQLDSHELEALTGTVERLQGWAPVNMPAIPLDMAMSPDTVLGFTISGGGGPMIPAVMFMAGPVMAGPVVAGALISSLSIWLFQKRLACGWSLMAFWKSLQETGTWQPDHSKLEH